jgi:serine/threonine-protein kinase RsbW
MPAAPKPRFVSVDRRNERSEQLHKALRDIGVEIEPLASAHAALNFLQAHFSEALLLEIPLPDMPISQMLATVRHRFPFLPIVVFAAEHDTAEAVGALDAGAFHVVPSTFEPRQVISTLRKILTLHHNNFIPGRTLPGLKQSIKFALPSSLDYIASAANHLTEALVRFGIITVEEVNIRIALVEAITNAIEHGNGFDSTRLVKVEANFSEAKAEIKITDTGKGFNHRKLPNPTAPENLFKPRGRGIYMMYRLMDEVHFNRKGNSVRLVKYRRPLKIVTPPTL